MEESNKLVCTDFTNHKSVLMLPNFYSLKGRQIFLDDTIMIRISLKIIWNWGEEQGWRLTHK